VLFFLKSYTKQDPGLLDNWFGPWLGILVHLFPADRYLLAPVRYSSPQNTSGLGNMMFNLIKYTPLATPRTVLIIVITSSNKWSSGKPALYNDINALMKNSFQSQASRKVCWIAAFGRHWQFGETLNDGEDAKVRRS
jgi:hypothetical protein